MERIAYESQKRALMLLSAHAIGQAEQQGTQQSSKHETSLFVTVQSVGL
jgi:hypothetical protein